jgi:thioredoxin-like negative regulator of GroEL
MRAPLLVALITLLPLLALADPTEPELMAQAQRAYIAGDYDTAVQLFGQVVEMDPQNTLAIQYLRRIKIALEAQGTPAQSAIGQIVLPKIDLRDATFSAALDFFKQEAAKQGATVSFVPQLPAAQMEAKITLNLTQIPFLDALTYLCQLNSATYKVETYAIVILPAPAATPVPGQ